MYRDKAYGFRALVYGKLLLTAIFWGGTFVAGRVAAMDAGPFSIAFLRFAVASVFLIALTARAERRFPGLEKGQVLALFLLGMTGVFAYNVLFFKGLKLIHAGRASLIIACNPVFITLFAGLVFRERLNLIKIFGILVSMAGAMIVITRGRPGEIFGGGAGWGDVFIFGCVASWVAYSLIGKFVMSSLSPLVSVSYSAVIGTLALLVPACAEGLLQEMTAYPARTWASIVYLGFFGTVLGFVWYYEGIKAIGPSRAGQFINFVPISAILAAFLLLGEPITWSLLVGGAFVLSGVYLTNTDFYGRGRHYFSGGSD